MWQCTVFHPAGWGISRTASGQSCCQQPFRAMDYIRRQQIFSQNTTYNFLPLHSSMFRIEQSIIGLIQDLTASKMQLHANIYYMWGRKYMLCFDWRSIIYKLSLQTRDVFSQVIDHSSPINSFTFPMQSDVLYCFQHALTLTKVSFSLAYKIIWNVQ
jgi:hypothetical protein